MPGRDPAREIYAAPDPVALLDRPGRAAGPGKARESHSAPQYAV